MAAKRGREKYLEQEKRTGNKKGTGEARENKKEQRRRTVIREKKEESEEDLKRWKKK